MEVVRHGCLFRRELEDEQTQQPNPPPSHEDTSQPKSTVVVIEAQPRLRNLQKEAVAFLPSSLSAKKKQKASLPLGSSSKQNTAADLDKLYASFKHEIHDL